MSDKRMHKSNEGVSEELVVGRQRYTVKRFRPLCGAEWDEKTTRLMYAWDGVTCPVCIGMKPATELALPDDANARLVGMSVNDRTVLRDWFAGNPHYAELVTYIDSLNADTMRRYGAAPKEEPNG